MKNRFKLLVTALIMTLSLSSWSQFNSIGVVGNATARGWQSWGNPMVQSLDNPNIFTWIGNLYAGELKFHADRDGDWNANKWLYAPAANSAILTASTYKIGINNDPNQPDDKWVVQAEEEGLYKITINVLENTIQVVPTAPIASIVGDACTAGWNPTEGLPFTPTTDPNILTWTGALGAGQFKINLGTGEWVDNEWFGPVLDGTSIMSGGQILTNDLALKSRGGNPDNKWKVSATEAGTYKISINLTDNTITILDSAHLGLVNLAVEKVAVYPNPVTNTLFFNTEMKGTNASVYSISGKSVSKQKITGNSIDVSCLNSGVYIVVFDKDGEKITKRFIKK